MLGAGVFVVFREAFALAGSWLWVSLGLAAAVASLNTASIYQLARQVDRPGGVYAYAMVYLSDKVARTAGLAFVLGKIASISAIGLVFGAYVLPDLQKPVAIALIAVLAGINISGIQRTATVAAVLAVTTVSFLTLTVALGLSMPAQVITEAPEVAETSDPQIIAAAAVFFFAFAGYARVATLGNEVKEAKVNVPRAIAISLAIVFVLYVALAFVLQPILAEAVSADRMPFILFFEAHNLPLGWLAVIVAAIAAAGSMLALLAGVSRTAAEMAADSALPSRLATRNKFGSPWIVEVLIATMAALLVTAGPISWVISLSSLGVLFYYAIGHLSALAQPDNERIFPKVFSYGGLALCLVLASGAGMLFASTL